MKKLNYLGCLLLLFCVVSCGYYVPEKDYSERLSKMEYKSFESLNNPFIFRFDAKLNFNSRVISRDRGSYYFIYDWENDEIFDYVYSPKDNTYKNFLLQCKTEDNNLEYFLIDSTLDKNFQIFSMRSNKNSVEDLLINEKEVIKDTEYFYFDNIKAQTGKNYQIFCGKSTDEIIFMYYEVNSKSFTKVKKIKVEGYAEVFVDSDGVCWYLECFSNKENGKVFERISSYNFATDTEIKDFIVFDCIGDSNTYDEYKGWIYKDNYQLIFVTSEYIVLKKSSYDRSEEDQEETSCYIVINKNDKTKKEFKLDSKNDYIKDFVKIQNEYYMIIDSSDDKFEIQKINFETLERTPLLLRKTLLYKNMEVRNNRIYFIDKTDWNIQEAEIQYFDVLENKFVECEKLVIEDFFEKIEQIK